MVQSEGNMWLKNPVTPPGIDPGTFRLVAQRLNHYATPGPRPPVMTFNKFEFYNPSFHFQFPIHHSAKYEMVLLSLHPTRNKVWVLKTKFTFQNQGKAIPAQVQRLPGAWGSQITTHSAHEGNMVAALGTGHFNPRRKYSWNSCLLETESTNGRNDPIGNWTRDLTACSAVPQPNAPPRASCFKNLYFIV